MRHGLAGLWCPCPQSPFVCKDSDLGSPGYEATEGQGRGGLGRGKVPAAGPLCSLVPGVSTAADPCLRRQC